MKPAPHSGRPRSFDEDQALDAAMRVFWRDGYEGASLSSLTAAMGINRPSLYAVFGNKDALFRKVLGRYESGPGAYLRKALDQPTALTFARRLLEGAADTATCPANPRGCLLVQSGLARHAASESLCRDRIARLHAGEKLVRARLRRAQKAGDLPPMANPRALARYLTTLIRGMAVDASARASRKDLQSVIETALQAWPAS